MKRLIVILLVTLALEGCATKKKMSETARTEHEATEQKDIRTEAHEMSQMTATGEWEGTTTGEADIEITHTEYDTSKPINPNTGKPPVAAETTAKISAKKRNEGKGAETVNTGTEKAAISQDSTKTTGKNTHSIRSEVKIKRSFPVWGYISIFAFIAGIVGVAWWLRKR